MKDYFQPRILYPAKPSSKHEARINTLSNIQGYKKYLLLYKLMVKKMCSTKAEKKPKKEEDKGSRK